MTKKTKRIRKDLCAAQKEIEKLWNAASGTAEIDHLDILSALAASYPADILLAG